ncbi:MAG: helix-turn-helix transcriptional regulator [Gemmiger formicilis]
MPTNRRSRPCVRRRRARAASALRRTPARPAACANAHWRSLSEHYMDEDLSLASLSAMLDVSPNHLSACIKKSEGETFINILVRRRMETAQTLLLTTDLQIQEIARRCGYTDQHYFSYCFKKYSGTSPVALRRARAAGRPGREAPAPHRSPGGSADLRRGRGGADPLHHAVSAQLPQCCCGGRAHEQCPGRQPGRRRGG